MKTGLALIAIVIVLVAGYFIFFNKKETTEAKPVASKQKQPRLAISKNPPAFNNAFGSLMTSYYTVKNDLVNWDSTKAANDAQNLSQLATQLPVDTLQADKNIILTAKNFASAISTESSKITSAKTIEEKRRAFSTVTDNLYSLINTVRYDDEVIYYDMCPMAFNGEEQAYWLSRDSAINNPYIGNKHPKYKGSMVTCGNVEQEIDYASAKK